MSKPYLYVTLLASVVFLGGPDRIHAQRVDAYLSEDSVSVGDRFTLTLIAIHGFDEIPSFPGTDSVFGDIIPLDLISAGTKEIDLDARLDSVVYAVTTFALDTARLAPLTIGFNNNAVTSVTPAQELHVTSLVPLDAEGIRDMAPPIDFERPLWPYVLLGLGILIATILIWYLIWHRRKTVSLPTGDANRDSRSPATIALERLEALQNAPLTERVQVESYYVELSETVRTYLEHQIQIPALESTTQELLQSLTHPEIQHQIPAGVPEQLEQILSLADLVKFAEMIPPISDGRTVLEQAVKVIQRIEIKWKQRVAGENLVPTD